MGRSEATVIDRRVFEDVGSQEPSERHEGPEERQSNTYGKANTSLDSDSSSTYPHVPREKNRVS